MIFIMLKLFAKYTSIGVRQHAYSLGRICFCVQRYGMHLSSGVGELFPVLLSPYRFRFAARTSPLTPAPLRCATHDVRGIYGNAGAG